MEHVPQPVVKFARCQTLVNCPVPLAATTWAVKKKRDFRDFQRVVGVECNKRSSRQSSRKMPSVSGGPPPS